MTNTLDAKGLEAFRAWYKKHTGQTLFRANAAKAITAYLSASPPQQVVTAGWLHFVDGEPQIVGNEPALKDMEGAIFALTAIPVAKIGEMP